MSEHEDERFAQTQERVGSVLCGKYRIERVLGIGGMATVYAGMHRNGRRVAVKMLHPELSARKDVRARFIREGLAANAVDHAGAVAVIDDEVAEDGAAFLVMERLEGKSVEQVWLDGGQRLPVRVVLALARELCDILAAAHRAGIVHRDIKPENLFLTSDGRLKVLDFGLARLRDAARPKETHTGMVFGTPAFMPPEQATGETSKIDACTDIWAVGATMFTLLSGKMVHEGETAQHFIMLSATKPARSLASVLPHAHPALVALVDRALSQDREHRWSSSESMRGAVVDATEMLLGAGVRPELPGHPGHASSGADEPDDPTRNRTQCVKTEGEARGSETAAEQTVRDRLPPIDGGDSSSPPTKPNARREAGASSDATEVRAPLFVIEEDPVTVERQRPGWVAPRKAVADSDRQVSAESPSREIVEETQRLASRPKLIAPVQSMAPPLGPPISRGAAHAPPLMALADRPSARRAGKTVSTRPPRALPFVIVGAALVGLSPLVYFVVRARAGVEHSPRAEVPVEVRANVIESDARSFSSSIPTTATTAPSTASAPTPEVTPLAQTSPPAPAPSTASLYGREPARSASAAVPAPPPSARCAQPYRLDADGIKHWKPECLQ